MAEGEGGALVPQVEETWLDRVIGFFSPVARARRLRGRAMGDILAGGYQGASGDRRALKEWDAPAGSADAKILSDLTTLRGRSRDLSRNSPYATGAVNTNVMSVVGGGIKVNPSVDRDVLGLGEEEAEAWERRAQTIFRTWAESEEADQTRVSNFYGLQNLAFRSVLESGDVLAIRRFDRRQGDVLGLQVQLVEADRISNPRGRRDQKDLSGGVEKQDGEPVAYHVREEHPGDTVLRVGIGGAPGNRWTRIPARGSTGERLSFLLYERKRPGQSRGVPYLAPVIEELKQLDRYSEAELMATVLSSMLTVFIEAESELYGPEGGGSFGLPDQPPGADAPEPDEGDVQLGQGTVMELAPGESIETVNPLRPNEAFADFEAAILKQVGAGLDIPLEVLQKHFQSSFSAARGALLEAWRAFVTRREWLTSRFCDQVYGWAIAEAVERGMLSAPGFFEDPMARKAWLGTQWIGPSRGTIRPDREVEAAAKRVEEGFSTRARETAAMTGEDWDRVHERRRREERMRSESEVAAAEPEPEPAPREEEA